MRDDGHRPGAGRLPARDAYTKPQDDTFFVIDRMARVQQLDRGNGLSEWRMPQWQRANRSSLRWP